MILGIDEIEHCKAYRDGSWVIVFGESVCILQLLFKIVLDSFFFV